MSDPPNQRRQRLSAPVTTHFLSRDDFAAILVDRGIAPERATTLFDALYESDVRAVLRALDMIAARRGN